MRRKEEKSEKEKKTDIYFLNGSEGFKAVREECFDISIKKKVTGWRRLLFNCSQDS